MSRLWEKYHTERLALREARLFGNPVLLSVLNTLALYDKLREEQHEAFLAMCRGWIQPWGGIIK